MDTLAEKTYVLKRHEKQFRLCHYNFDIEKERHIFLGYNQFKTEDDANKYIELHKLQSVVSSNTR